MSENCGECLNFKNFIAVKDTLPFNRLKILLLILNTFIYCSGWFLNTFMTSVVLSWLPHYPESIKTKQNKTHLPSMVMLEKRQKPNGFRLVSKVGEDTELCFYKPAFPLNATVRCTIFWLYFVNTWKRTSSLCQKGAWTLQIKVPEVRGTRVTGTHDNAPFMVEDF